MFLNRKEIKAKAKAILHKNYWAIIGLCIFFSVISGIVSAVNFIPALGNIVCILIMPIITVGFSYQLFYAFSTEEKPDVAGLFAGFKDGRYGHVLGGYWYCALFTVLWTFLFIIPGIVKSISYSMTPYILMDQPEISATDALKLSMKMTKGHKWKIFVFSLSFIGWHILSVFTLGILEVFYVLPYQSLATAGIYATLKEQYQGSNVETF